jgi:ABC-2 type transport system ATP-binding protein
MSLVVQNLKKTFGEHLAVEDLSFELTQPGVMALLGSNGAGKTTAIRMMLGMLNKTGGSIMWNGKPLVATNERVGYLAEERGLYSKINIIEQMVYFAKLKGLTADAAKRSIDFWFERLGLNEYRKKLPGQLSKGNQQKVQLTAALISDPELLILDEPLSGLDPVNTDLFKSVIREEIGKHKYVIMSSHQMPIVEEFCENIIILHRGGVVLQGNLNYIKRGYGRVNLSVKADEDVKALAKQCGLTPFHVTPNGDDYKVQNEEQAKAFLRLIAQNDVTLVKYELREPSLHEIFVEKVTGREESLQAADDRQQTTRKEQQ